MRGQPAAFLDRDGVLNRRPAEHDYVRSSAQLELMPDAALAVSELARGGFAPIVISNQRGVARGIVTEAALAEIEAAIRQADIPVDAFYYCVHDHGAGCPCRKPKPGLILRAVADRGLSLEQSVMIGDSETDVAAGRAAGCHTVLIGAPGAASDADVVATTLLDATRLVLRRWPPRHFGGD